MLDYLLYLFIFKSLGNPLKIIFCLFSESKKRKWKKKRRVKCLLKQAEASIIARQLGIQKKNLNFDFKNSRFNFDCKSTTQS